MSFEDALTTLTESGLTIHYVNHRFDKEFRVVLRPIEASGMSEEDWKGEGHAATLPEAMLAALSARQARSGEVARAIAQQAREREIMIMGRAYEAFCNAVRSRS